MNLSVPRAEQLPDKLGKLVAEYRDIAGRLQTAQNNLATLRYSAEQARLADAQLVADAARANRDVTKVGTPNADRLNAEIRQAATVADGLLQAYEQVQTEVMHAMRAGSAESIALAKAEAQRLLGPYLDAIGKVEQAARDYDATLYLLNGWLTFAESDGQRYGFGQSGSLRINGAFHDPLNLTQLTATLRTHARRLDLLTAALDKASGSAPTEPGKAGKRTREESFEESDHAVWAA